MDELYHELKLVSEGAIYGTDVIVAEQFQYSLSYIKRLKRGEIILIDTPDNREKIQTLIHLYRKENRAVANKLKEIS